MGLVGRVVRFAGRLLVAVFIGVATLFTRKTDPDQHWSIPPTWPAGGEHGEAGDPSGPRPGR